MAKSLELTGPQKVSLVTQYPGTMTRDTTNAGTYANYRDLSKDPTVSLGRGLLVAGILAGSWSVESDEDASEQAVDMVRGLLPIRENVMRNAVTFGRVDFGWQGFEKIFAIKDGRLVLERLKPLLQDITTILVDVHGNLSGYRQTDTRYSSTVDVPLEKILHIVFGAGPGDLYGLPLLENIRATQTSYDECDAGAKRYDEKIAGSHWVIKYPPGTSVVEGESVNNGEVASQMLALLQSSGSVAIPTTVATNLQELNDQNVTALYAWSVELIADEGSGQAGFGERLKYLDALKVRGLGLPERAMLEGSHGTLAEADAHGDLAVLIMESTDRTITKAVNEQVVNQLLELNFGPGLADTVRLVATPLVDKQVGFLRTLYAELEDPDLDVAALRESLDLGTAENSNKPENDDG